MSWDTQILLFTATLRSEGLDGFFRGITWLGSLYVLAPITALISVILLYFQKRAEVLLLLVGFGGATLLVHLAKAILDRPRPSVMEPLVVLPTDSSFPSAHTTHSVAFALCMVLIIRRILPEWQFTAMAVALMLAVAVATSRIYLQVHFPSDVMAGITLGIGWVVLAQKLL
ncbi:MAG: phosphatase PAP2 family protein [Candidatus Competibacter sp.]|nr:phosphatase PAP2 family protein [Candidatus Competibacter sp.]MDG4605712.1 phosphatase PAP2 family protein [Candidatus Contendobacter sp.]HRD49685.1 phosphatase PAP2 family protein [Candidatus Contendobacter sp.]